MGGHDIRKLSWSPNYSIPFVSHIKWWSYETWS